MFNFYPVSPTANTNVTNNQREINPTGSGSMFGSILANALSSRFAGQPVAQQPQQSGGLLNMFTQQPLNQIFQQAQPQQSNNILDILTQMIMNGMLR